ncbi:MAG: acetolactate decarboxylase [Flavobacteriia bacterium]|nr:acetolactate decarboxylase [Flavobacteriia bacterium]
MHIKALTFGVLPLVLIACQSSPAKETTEEPAVYPDIEVVGAMRNVMWEGKLGSGLDLDTLSNKAGLYGLGPVSYLTGELLINNGQCYVSKVTSDSTMTVEKTFATSAPFFVYGHIEEWREVELPSQIKTIQQLESFIDEQTVESKRPFAFKVVGHVSSAVIHIQNLPAGTTVSSPQEAHQGQTNYTLIDEDVEIVGFFSTEHKGIFTHHDSFLHMHLITADESKMGHLDAVEMKEMKLMLPVR